ncbi:NRDE protein-domain-containing protein [Boletus edulis BED1]|uniref:NRDE protein-domain-containing protein n=1 Tax=Boletus edulis BED1 TaxID=1328754 RepID=A0AAD4BY10_BOLED|nr:NRDE protein-domain-containing protein [Boletus edulis BED1]
MMCVAFFTLDHPDYALILCSNRDEHLARPTKPACFHAFGGQLDPSILSGIDVQAGGTWLGLSRTGKLALLTNITEQLNTTFASSRGSLVSSFLTSPPSAASLEDEVRQVVPPDAQYAGFNLLLLTPTRPPHASPTLSFDALYVTNHGAGGPITYRALTDAQRHRGGLSNGIDGHGADEWPKVQHGVRALDALLGSLPPNTSDDQLTERLFDLLTWRSSQPPRHRSELKNTIQAEPIVIDDHLYGTRLSTVVLVKRSGEVVFTERDRWITEQGRSIMADPSSQRVFRFQMERGELSTWSM